MTTYPLYDPTHPLFETLLRPQRFIRESNAFSSHLLVLKLRARENEEFMQVIAGIGALPQRKYVIGESLEHKLSERGVYIPAGISKGVHVRGGKGFQALIDNEQSYMRDWMPVSLFIVNDCVYQVPSQARTINTLFIE